MASQAIPIPSPQQRVIRVFVSSTFRDMQAERNELVKRVFPQLRKLCESRGVIWGEVDLRWGITDEQKAEGKVLPICLEEIRRCRPYFIGLLGERYGWVPDGVPPELIEREPWLAEHRGQSVTELEILHGVLNDPEMADHAFFYFRDPSYVNSLPFETREGFEETPTTEEIKALGLEQAKRRAGERKQKLRVLKQGIRMSALPVHENYADPQTLGRLVLDDLSGIINQLFPEGSQPHPLDGEAEEHEAFARSRTGVYIGRKEYFAALDAHAAGNSAPLVVLGESGLGKSALLANWATRYRAAHPEELLLMHFIGATPASADWAAIVRRFVGEFNRRFDLKIPIFNKPDAIAQALYMIAVARGLQVGIPDSPDTLRSTFANALSMAATKGRVIIILDALNQLEDHDQAPDLVWLPPVLPAEVRLIVSTLPGRPLDDIKKRGWPTIQIGPLKPEERNKLIAEYLQQFTKELNVKRAERIAQAPQSANPLYLRALLDEMRVWGDYAKLDDRIEHYLGATTVPALYAKILDRYEEDYERERPGLVRDAMTLLWAARRGLSEAEVMELLGGNGQPLPRAYWSPLYLAAEQALTSRSGLIGFSHDHLRQAIQESYLPTVADQQRAHSTLALYFGGQPQGPRQLDELPWQWQAAREWRSLAELLGQSDFFDALWGKYPFEVEAYWARIERESHLRMEQIYAATIENPARNSNHAWRIGVLLRHSGKSEAALRVYATLVENYREQGDQQNLQAALGQLANILFDRGDLDKALAVFKEEERLCRELGNTDGLQRSLGNQAAILGARGDLDSAMALYNESENLCRNKDALQGVIGRKALILDARGDSDGALALCKEAERICRELGNKDGLHRMLNSQANILKRRGDLHAAIALHKEAEALCRELGNKDGLRRTLNSQASILDTCGDRDGAMALCAEAERICRESTNKGGLQEALSIQANILKGRKNLDGSMALYKEAEDLCREIDYKFGLPKILDGEASILYARGDLDGALVLCKEAESICQELLYKDGLQWTLGTQGNVLYARGDPDGAMALYKEAERICRQIGNKFGLQRTLDNQAVLRYARRQLDGLMPLLEEQEQLCRELEYKNGLQRALAAQANILIDQRNLDKAMILCKEQERLCRELDDEDDLAGSVGRQGLILKSQGQLDGAMALYTEAERLCRKLDNRALLQVTVGNQANILYDCGDLVGAVAKYKEQESLCRDLGNKGGLQRALSGQALILHIRADRVGGTELYKEAERSCREPSDKPTLLNLLGDQANILNAHANILFDRKDREGAMALFKEAERLYRELPSKSGIANALGGQALILHDRGDRDGAMTLLKEQELILRELANPEGVARSLATQALLLSKQPARRNDARQLTDEALAIATHYGCRHLVPQIKRIRQSIPPEAA